MTEQLIEAGMLLAVGMTVVFSFLTLLIGGIHGIAWFVRAFPAPEMSQGTYKPSYNNKKKQDNHQNKRLQPTTVKPNIAKAIGAAINEHRRAQKKTN